MKNKDQLMVNYIENTTNWSNGSNDSKPLDNHTFISIVNTFLDIAKESVTNSKPVTALIQSK
jgi:hypothetical protein